MALVVWISARASGGKATEAALATVAGSFGVRGQRRSPDFWSFEPHRDRRRRRPACSDPYQ
jgi:hypothetical protein